MPVRFLLIALSCGAMLLAQTPPRFDAAHMDRGANPCVDFYQYACGTWMAKNPVPPDLAVWGRMAEVAEQNRVILRDILEKAAAGGAGRSAVEQKIGDHYAACMDERAVEERGIAPLKPDLERIAAIKDRAGFAAVVARLHRIGAAALFRFGSMSDMKDSVRMIAGVDQGGLSLPDRDYYLKDDARSTELRAAYQTHLRRMIALLGEKPEDAAAKAQVVMELETGLARASLDRVTLRDPARRYHKMTRHELGSLAPEVPWDRYFAEAGAPAFDTLNIAVPPFFRGLDELLNRTPLDKWKVYLTWHLVNSQAENLPAAFVNENFDFFGKRLLGMRELRPRWKRCVAAVDGELGEALGQKYVERTFGADGKTRTLKMVEALEQALAKDIEELPWMTPATRKRAAAKLHAITNKIGYPEKWRDYSSVAITRDDVVGNSVRAGEFAWNRRVAKIGTATDPKEWGMTPPTVNAYYSPSQNNINFPAGILQPPFFDRSMDDAVNFGAIGAIIGHELTHGFDDQGRKFDAQGNLSDWWTAEDAREFEKRAECFVRQYAGYEGAPGVKLNGKLTLGENAADGGGVRVAYMALLSTLSGKPAAKIDGFSPEQRFFLGWAQVWCQNRTEEFARRQAVTDPHSPGKWRVNGVVSSMPEFQKAFGCTQGQPMVREEACRVW
ncbi:MAG TPA: M13 family metallopeptidase [Bryobacteraceae bacterium]|nr:M13 family metallopeptidase [Bryobacteraceae bacterium]